MRCVPLSHPYGVLARSGGHTRWQITGISGPHSRQENTPDRLIFVNESGFSARASTQPTLVRSHRGEDPDGLVVLIRLSQGGVRPKIA